jgi:hypothetical protein
VAKKKKVSAEFLPLPKGKSPLARLRELADQYAATQRVLFAAENRLRAVEQGADPDPGVPTDTRDPFCAKVAESLEVLLTEMERYIGHHPAYQWLMGVPGINRTLACKLAGFIRMESAEDFHTFGQLRRWMGYAPGFDKAVKGQKLPYLKVLKTAVFVCGTNIIKAAAIARLHPKAWHPPCLYPEIYDKWRVVYALRHGCGERGEAFCEKIKENCPPCDELISGNDLYWKLQHATGQDVYKYAGKMLGNDAALGFDPETKLQLQFGPYREHRESQAGKTVPVWPDIRQHFAALRKMYDVFMSHLWRVWRETKGWPVEQLYVHKVLGHQFHYDPQAYSSSALAERKIKEHASPVAVESIETTCE